MIRAAQVLPRVLAIVSEATEVPAVLIRGQGRTVEVAWARHCVAYLLRSLHFSAVEVAQAMGRTHGNVLNSCDRVESEIESSATIECQFDLMRAQLREVETAMVAQVAKLQREQMAVQKMVRPMRCLRTARQMMAEMRQHPMILRALRAEIDVLLKNPNGKTTTK